MYQNKHRLPACLGTHNCLRNWKLYYHGLTETVETRTKHISVFSVRSPYTRWEASLKYVIQFDADLKAGLSHEVSEICLQAALQEPPQWDNVGPAGSPESGEGHREGEREGGRKGGERGMCTCILYTKTPRDFKLSLCYNTHT